MSKEEKTKYLEDLDVVLNARGFRRRRTQQQWNCRVGSRDELWIHINFGKSVVNPSFGVKYLDLASVLPEESGAVTGTMVMLSYLFDRPRSYTIEEGSEPVARDLFARGLEMLFTLQNRGLVIEMLRSEVPFDWPVVSYSDRIRLLPILLANENRVSEALDLLEHFRSDSIGRDQMLPKYHAFAAIFRERFET
jgi:hypothetical protein